jgi:catechol 2,3-dioxygenase-like lactoylglutathione lyase family enzyme
MADPTADLTGTLTRGVDHAAFPTFDPVGTVRFYHEILGFPIVHSVCAVGWGPEDHPDFVHFFFDIGAGSRVAFFYYFGHQRLSDEPGRDSYSAHGPEVPEFFRNSRHLALHVETVEELEEYQRRLGAWENGVEMRVKHETIESIYTHDPNGYLVEITCPTRETTETDDRDAALTVAALVDVVSSGEPTLAKLWARKAELIVAAAGEELEEVPVP